MKDITGVVLAGGRSSRMGASKARAELGGRPLIDRPLQAMRAAGLEVAVVAKPATELPDLDVDVWLEPDEPSHPLTGVVAALEQARGPLVVCGCDMPFVPAALLSKLAARVEPFVVVEGGGRLHPLLGRYDPSLVDALREARDAEQSLHDVVAELDGARLAADRNFLFNVNTPGDLARAEQLLRRS